MKLLARPQVGQPFFAKGGMRYAVHARCARVIERLAFAYHTFASVTHLGQPIWKATFCPLLQVQVLIVASVILS